MHHVHAFRLFFLIYLALYFLYRCVVNENFNTCGDGLNGHRAGSGAYIACYARQRDFEAVSRVDGSSVACMKVLFLRQLAARSAT